MDSLHKGEAYSRLKERNENVFASNLSTNEGTHGLVTLAGTSKQL